MRPVVFAAAGALALLAGCATEPEPFHPLETTKYTLENTDRLAVDRATQHAVTCTGLYDRLLANGRMEVVANLRNREKHKLEVQASCVFKDESGINLLEETAWQPVSIAENATATVHFTATNPLSKKYTIRVRQAR